MDTTTRNHMLARLADAIGPGPFNQLLASKDDAQTRGRLRFWQEDLLRKGGMNISTIEEFVDLFEGAEPRSMPPPKPLTKSEFLREPNNIWNSNRRDEVPLEWFALAWREVPSFRESLTYELGRYASKIGELNAPDLLPVLSAVLKRDEVLSLYEDICNHGGRESEWRQEFDQAFPAHAGALPPLRDKSGGEYPMTIAEFVASPLAGDCTLLKRLYEFDRTARKKNLHLGITLLDIGPYGGTILYDPTKTPTNSLTFATTGGDDVHFSLVAMNGNFGDSSPVVITIPMAGKTPRETNFIVGETLRDFLQLGCVRGFFDLEELAYPWKTKMFDRYSQPPANTDDPVYEQFRTEFSLTPWSNIEPRLQVLDTKYWSTLRFHRD